MKKDIYGRVKGSPCSNCGGIEYPHFCPTSPTPDSTKCTCGSTTSVYGKLRHLKTCPLWDDSDPTDSWEKIFDGYVSDIHSLLPDEGEESEIMYFGYKHRKNNEYFTVTDWGNIKKFISEVRQKAWKEGYEKGYEDSANDA